jgi:hypothetical protein
MFRLIISRLQAIYSLIQPITYLYGQWHTQEFCSGWMVQQTQLRTEDRGQRAEGRGQRAEGRGIWER